MKRILQIITLFAMVAILASCGTTSKIKSYSKSSVDSSSVTKIDSNVTKTDEATTVKKDNTVTTIEKQDDYTKETVIEFSTDFAPGVTKKQFDSLRDSGKPLTTLTKEDFTDWITNTDYFPPVRKITIKETGIKKEKHIIAANTVDSSTVSKKETVDFTKTVNTELHKTEVVKNKTVKRTSYWGWLWIALFAGGVFAVGWYFGWWRWLFAWIKQRKKDDEYPVKSKKT